MDREPIRSVARQEASILRSKTRAFGRPFHGSELLP
jgi:hypothetical protein